MKRVVAIAGAILLMCATPGFAHRLDEYLQAATILVSKDRVQIQLRLVPGVAVLSTVLDSIDTDANGVISSAEERAYSERVLRDLSLSVDDERLPLRLVSTRFASIDELRRGLGENRLELEATLTNGARTRRVLFENRHQSRIAAYLVNGLVPKEPDIQIVKQTRNYEQSLYEMSISSGSLGAGSASFGSLLRWSLLIGAAAIVLLSQLAPTLVSTFSRRATR